MPGRECIAIVPASTGGAYDFTVTAASSMAAAAAALVAWEAKAAPLRPDAVIEVIPGGVRVTHWDHTRQRRESRVYRHTAEQLRKWIREGGVVPFAARCQG